LKQYFVKKLQANTAYLGNERVLKALNPILPENRTYQLQENLKNKIKTKKCYF
jgi:hypothetical protein